MEHPKRLLEGIANGSKIAFKTLYNLFVGKVYNTALSYVQHEQDAEEVTQDVFIKIYKGAAKFKGNSSVSTWIYKITINTSLNFLRKKKRFSFLKLVRYDLNKSDFEHPHVLLEKKEHHIYLFKTINKLSDNQKTAFILSFIEQLSRKEVADIMELSLKAVESLLQRAKGNLRKELRVYYETYFNRNNEK